MSLRCPSAPYHRTSTIMDMHDTPNRSLDLDISDSSETEDESPTERESRIHICSSSAIEPNCYGTVLSGLSEASYDELFRCDS
jgi:hypothetical protein